MASVMLSICLDCNSLFVYLLFQCSELRFCVSNCLLSRICYMMQLFFSSIVRLHVPVNWLTMIMVYSVVSFCTLKGMI